MREKKHLGLTIRKKKLGVKSLAFLGDFTHLERVSVYDVSGGIKVLSKLKNLKEVALCGVSTKDLSFLSELPKLERLWFQGSRLKNYDSFRSLTQIKAVDFFLLRSLDSIEFVEDMISLQYLGLTNCSSIETFPSLKNLLALRRVYIDTLNRLRSISGVAEAPALEDLIIRRTRELPADSLKDFVAHPTIKAQKGPLDVDHENFRLK